MAPGEFPILVRLRDVRDLGGDPVDLLRAWAMSGYSFRGAEAIDQEALRNSTPLRPGRSVTS